MGYHVKVSFDKSIKKHLMDAFNILAFTKIHKRLSDLDPDISGDVPA